MRVLVILTRRQLETIKADVANDVRLSLQPNVSAGVARELDARAKAAKAQAEAERKSFGGWAARGSFPATAIAAIAGVALTLLVHWILTQQEPRLDGVPFLERATTTLVVVGAVVAGTGGVMRAMVHNRKERSDQWVDHAGKLLAVTGISAPITVALLKTEEGVQVWWAALALDSARIAGLFLGVLVAIRYSTAVAKWLLSRRKSAV